MACCSSESGTTGAGRDEHHGGALAHSKVSDASSANGVRDNVIESVQVALLFARTGAEDLINLRNLEKTRILSPGYACLMCLAF
jgi:hypothetical protein